MKIVAQESCVEFGVKRDSLNFIELEINGGDQQFLVFELDGELKIKKIDPSQPNRKSKERIEVYPVSATSLTIR